MRSGLEAGLADGHVSGVEFTQATQSNAVFACLPPGVADQLRERFRFYEPRWVCSFDTQPEDVDAFIAALAKLTSG